MNIQQVKQGETIEVGFYLEGSNGLESLDGWTCRMQLRDYNTKQIVAGVDRDVTVMNADSTEFLGVITGEECAQLVVDESYVVACELVNTGGGIKRETDPLRIIIAEQWVF